MEENLRIKYKTIINKYPSFRDEPLKGVWRWLEGRQEDDNAEGFWRVHDKLYNLNDFIESHPGGSEWITLTKGTDITEAFESYHILPKASVLLNKFYVKDADKPRNYRLTYKENGFYRVLKRRVAEKLPYLDRRDLWKSKFYLDLILCGFFISSIMTMRVESMPLKILFIVIASQFTSWLNAASHNFNHQRNNWRMYTASLILIGWRDWRVFHSISHHLYPNSYADFEASGYEPYVTWLPVRSRSKFRIICSYFLTPFLYTQTIHYFFLSRNIGLFLAKDQKFHWDEFLGVIPPLMMFVFGSPPFTLQKLLHALFVFNIIILLGSALFFLLGANAGHHGYEIVHEGDEFKDLDFGIYQMAATVDRIEANYNLPMAITHFGYHNLHHLFPSLDHALLPQLYEVFLDTCKEFDQELREWTLLHAVLEQYRQLARTKVTTLKPINNNDS